MVQVSVWAIYLKYAQRYGKKEGKNKNDLLKVIHYAIIQLSQDHY